MATLTVDQTSVLFSEEDMADIVACAIERGIEVSELIYVAVMEDLAR